jgi:hypothetical protein
MVYRVEAGEPASTDLATSVAAAIGHRVELQLVDPRRRDRRPNLNGDAVHSAMGEYEARHLRSLGFSVGIDEPYQHFQFAGRADVLSWSLEAQALLHIENRTRFPDFQEMAGAYNAKRAYLASAVGERLGIGRWRTETHVIAALWSSEVLHSIRLRAESFRSLCPDSEQRFRAWWDGVPPEAGRSSSLIVVDPLASKRQRSFIGLDDVLAGARPRYRGYVEAARELEASA